MKSGVSGEFDFGYVGFAVFESLESFEVCFVCWGEYAARVFNQVDLQSFLLLWCCWQWNPVCYILSVVIPEWREVITRSVWHIPIIVMGFVV